MMIMVFAVAVAMAQAPEKFSYQAVVRNANNALVTNAPVSVRVSILQGSVTGSIVYMEMHTVPTNANGLLTIEIGGGTVQQGSFAGINWANGPFFLKMETDPAGGSNYSITSVQQLMSVPYALYAKDAGNIPTVPANVSAFTNDAGYITAQDIPEIPTVPTNVSAFVNDVPYMTSFTEQQILTISNDTIFLTGGSFVKLPEGFNGDYNSLTNTPSIPTVPTNVSAFVNDMGYLTSFTEQQVLNISNDTIFLTGGSFVKLPAGFDGDYNNLTNTPDIPTVPTEVSVFNNDANYVSNTECADVDLCALAALVSSLQGQLTELQGQLAELQSTIDSLTVPDTTVTPVATLPTVITDAVSDITETTATCGGEVTSDGGVAVTERGVCWSTSASPTVADNHTSDGAGLGTFTSNITGLTASTTYYVRAYAINSVGTAYGETVTFTTEASPPVVHGQPCPGTPTVTDYDGNIYNTVLIGTQCWTKENLRTTHYADGTAIPAGGSNTSYTEPYYYDYSTHSLPLETRGYLYNWSAAMHGAASSNANPSGVQGICPAGWHLPSDAEWTQLTDYVKTQGDYVCGGNTNYIGKALASTEGWNTYSGSCTVGNDQTLNNASGFGAVPAGDYWEYGFLYAGYFATFWSSAQSGSNYAYFRNMGYDGPNVGRSDNLKNYGFSVRCLRDEDGTDTTQSTLPTVITSAVSDVTETTATCGGEVTSDGGATVTERGVCWSTSASPTVADTHTSDGMGMGTFTSSIANLTASTTYYVCAYATNSVGTAYGETVTFTTEASTPVVHGQPCPGTPTVTDHEGNVYATVQIGNQCWMRDNLRTTTSPSTGTYLIPTADASYTYTGKQARWYDNDSATYAPMNYGLLYNWNAAVDTFNTAYGETSVSTNGNNSVSVSFTGNRRGICPSGWHLPSDAEWTQLTDYVSNQSEYTCGGNSSYIAKALASETGWNSHTNTCAVGNDPSANNAMGFSAVPAGYCSGSSFYNAGYYANFCSSSQYPNNRAWTRTLNYNSANVLRSYNTKYNGYSVRCLRNEGGIDTIQSTLPTVITGAVSDITETTATCGGEVIADGGATVTERGVCWSTSVTPTVADNHTSDGAGLGTFTSSITGLTANTTYYVRAYATNSVGTAYGETVNFTTEATTPVVDGQPCPGTPTVTDHEGNVYATVQIGNQCWMRDNLRTTTSPSTGTYLIPTAGTGYTYTGKQARWYDNDSATYAPMNYGLLYNWNAAVDTFNTAYGETSVNTSSNQAVSVSFTGNRRGICPAGWHLPSNAEWTQLFGQIDYICYGTGFSAIPAGRYLGSSFNSAGYFATFWTSTQGDSGNAYRLLLNCNNARLIRNDGSKGDGFSVRCLRDDTTQATLPTVITDAVSDITETTATCGGEVTSDGGVAVTERGVCWSTSASPTVADNHTSDGAGLGTFTSNITGLTASTTYYVRAYAINSVGTAYGETVTFTTEASPPVVHGQPCPGTPTVTDYDGNIYNTVLIGTQCWTKENLRTTHYADGTAIPAGGSNTSYTEPYYYDYSTHSLPLETRGYLYNWSAAMHGAASSNANPSGVQGICPAGWHLPSDAEWTQLTNYVGSQSEYTCGGNSSYIAKALASETGWNSHTNACAVGNDPSANNASGFSAVPAGDGDGSYFDYAGSGANFWSSTEYSSDIVWDRFLDFGNADVGRYENYKFGETSVRCLRDEDGTDTTQSTLPTVITSAVSDITETTATCGGEVIADGGVAVTERGVCWSTSATPTVADNHTSDGAGLGTFTSNITGLTASTTYYVRAYATNSVGTAYGETINFTTSDSVPNPVVDGQPCPEFATVTDYDGNTYNTVQIGQQCWMRENLRTTHYASGTAITAGGSTTSNTEPYYYDYSSQNFPLEKRGYLYNWPAVMHGVTSSNTNPIGVQGICPNGWHLPSDAEWTLLTDYVSSQPEYTCGGNSSYIAKALASVEGWGDDGWDDCHISVNLSTNNTSGFSAFPAGQYWNGFFDLGYGALFWSSTTDGSNNGAYIRDLFGDGAVVYRDGGNWDDGYSVRCLRDEGGYSASLPTIITSEISDITETTVTCGGEVIADGGAEISERGVCWGISTNPTIADAHTSNGTGMGTFISNIIGLSANTTYFVRAFATNIVGTTYGETMTFTTVSSDFNSQPCPGTPTVTDYDSNTYNTVQIGDQCWMRENLRTTHYADGTAISAGGSTTSISVPYYYVNSPLDAAVYGYYYNWAAAMHGTVSSALNPSGVQGICPTGWHLPSDEEWTQLTNYVGGQSEYTCGSNSSRVAKALASTEGWNTTWNTCVVGHSPNNNNTTGFSAVPAGYWSGSSFNAAGNSTHFWSSTETGSETDNTAYERSLDYNGESVRRGNDSKIRGFSVRCIRGNSATLPTVSTSTLNDITETTATCGGEVISDGGAEVIERGICWGTSINPTVFGSHISDGMGIGTFITNISGLTAGTTYYVRAYAINSVGTAYGEDAITFTTNSSNPVLNGQPCTSTPTVTDIDGNVYNTVQIGDQCWMRENLRVMHYSDGSSIPIGVGSTSNDNPYYYVNNSLDATVYGYYYNWPAAMHGAASSSVNPSGVQGICPVGWHLPSDAEWTQLAFYVGGRSEYTCGGNSNYIAKALASTEGWLSTSGACQPGNQSDATNNASGFSIVPAGYYDYGFNAVGNGAYFWSTTPLTGSSVFGRFLYKYNAYMGRTNSHQKQECLSVRCLRDEATPPTVTTGVVRNVTEISAMCNGEVTDDGGVEVTERGICWGTSSNPTIVGNHVVSGTGSGAFTVSLSGITASTTYYVRAYATNSVGTAYGEELTFTTTNSNDGQPCSNFPNVTDIDGNTYNTVQIGNQCWMRENLRTTHYSDGTAIPIGDSVISFTEPYYYDYSSHSLPLETRGYLYNWPAAMHSANNSNTNPNGTCSICPTGWHLPSDAEWTTLTNYVGSQNEYIYDSNINYIAKALASTDGWNSSNDDFAIGNDQAANNTTGFSAVPAGLCYGSSFSYAEYSANFWSSTQNANYYSADGRSLDNNNAIVHRDGNYKCYGRSVRCLRD